MSTNYTAFVRVGYAFPWLGFFKHFYVRNGIYAFDGQTFENIVDSEKTVEGRLLDVVTRISAEERLLCAVVNKIGAWWATHGEDQCDTIVITPRQGDCYVNGTSIIIGRLTAGDHLNYRKIVALESEVVRIGLELSCLGLSCEEPGIFLCCSN